MRVPLRPDYAAAARTRQGQPLIRAIASFLAAEGNPTHAAAMLRQNWPSDRDAETLLDLAVQRTAFLPASLTTSGWADSLAMSSVADLILSMGGASAGAALLRAGMSLAFDGAAAISVPGTLAAAGGAGFVQEASAIPVRKLTLAGVTLAPRKFASISVFNREMFQHSKPNIELLVRAVLVESLALALDTALLDGTAGDAIRPAGLRNGISGLTASATTPPSEAMSADVKALVAAVAPVAGNSGIIIVAAPPQAATLKLAAGPRFAFEILSSSALAAGTVLCITSNAVASAIDPVPRFSLSDAATVVLDDAGVAFGTAGSPNVVGAPAKSLWQADGLGLKMIFEVSWGLRNSAGLAWTSSVTW